MDNVGPRDWNKIISLFSAGCKEIIQNKGGVICVELIGHVLYSRVLLVECM